ncbi:MAG: DUF402 domain-containing protein [Nocardioides sp.]
MTTASTWAAGETVVWRYTRPRHPSESVRPMRVVRDDGAGLVAWLPAGTPVLRPVLGDGRELRSVPVPERYDVARHGRANRLDTWHGNGVLKVAPAGRPWSVWLFRADDGFRGWYVNLESVHERRDHEVVTQDHVLDVVVGPDGSSERKDADELAAAVAGGRFTAAEAVRIEAAAAAVEDVVRRWGSPFRDGWESWEPDPSWPRPALPAAYVEKAAYR